MRVKKQKQKSIKAEFLKSLKWKRWRYTMLDYYNNKDCITNKPLRNRWNLHQKKSSLLKKVTGDESKKSETEKHKSGVLEVAQVEKVEIYSCRLLQQ